MKKLSIYYGLLSAILLTVVQAATVPNLGSVPGAIVHKEGKQIFDEQMRGLPPTKEFGGLPSGLNETEFINWLAPGEDPSLLTLTGAKVWGNDGTYIGVACFARNTKDAASAKKYKDTDCSEDFDLRRAKNFYLGVFTWRDQTFRPVARTEKPLNISVSWENSDLTGPISADDGEETFPQTYKKLDLAPYRIKSDIMAFGVRAQFSEGYSGGGAFFEALQLFMVKDGQVVNILSEPMYFYQDIAGEWNKDGTRNHDINEGKNILKVLGSQTDGYYDLQIKSIDSKWSRNFGWSMTKGKYVIKQNKTK